MIPTLTSVKIGFPGVDGRWQGFAARIATPIRDGYFDDLGEVRGCRVGGGFGMVGDGISVAVVGFGLLGCD